MKYSKTQKRPVALKTMLLLVSAIPLASCQTHGAGECQVFKPITSSTADTRETLNQIAVHNDKGVFVCGWKAK